MEQWSLMIPSARIKNKENKSTLVPIAELFLPREIIIEILSWLPVESLLRCKCVCKQWYALIQDRHFIEIHMRRMRQTRGSFVFGVARDDGAPNTDGTVEETWEFIAACDGLLLERSVASHKYSITNPKTCQVLYLPDPHETSSSMIFAFVPSTGDYKVVSIYDQNENTCNIGGCEVLTIGSNNHSWRDLKITKLHDINTERELILFCLADGAIHVVRIIEVGLNISEVVSLDLEKECVTSTTFPQGFFSNWKRVQALPWNDKLSFVDIVEEQLNVLVLEDYKKNKWCERKISLRLMKENPPVPPLSIHSGYLFWVNDNRVTAYDIELEKIRDIVSAPEGASIFVCYLTPSLVTLKGMQPEKRMQPKPKRPQMNLQSRTSFEGSSSLLFFSFLLVPFFYFLFFH